MAMTSVALRGVSITFKRGTNDVEVVYVGDKPYGKKGNGSVADFGTAGAAETFATSLAANCNAAPVAISGRYGAKDEEATIPADDGTSVSGTFVITPEDVSKQATCPPINVYVPKILKAAKIADVATLLKGLDWKSKASVDYGIVKVKFSQIV